jgi:hypothetical protein
VADVIERPGRITGGVLDRAAHEPDAGGQEDGLRRHLRRVAEALLQIGGDGQVARANDGVRVREGFIARHLAVSAAERAG